MATPSLASLADLATTVIDANAARVWNYWFARRSLGRAPSPAVDPFAEGYVFDHLLWFHAGADVDAEIGLHFRPLVERAARGELDGWKETARDCLSLVLLLDQLSRHIYRGTAAAFALDPHAVAVAEHALAHGFDRELAPAEALFFFLALVHAEDLALVRRGLSGIEALLTRCTRAQQRQAKGWRVSTLKHVHLLERFGRYPHRNAALGRASTPDEEAFLLRPEFSAVFMRSQTPRQANQANQADQADQAARARWATESSEQGASLDAAAEPSQARAQRAGPRLRILAIHGFRQNGAVFRKRTRKMRQALEDIADFTFVTSPMNYTPRGETRAATLAAFGELPDYPMQQVWWLSSEDNREYEGFDASVAFLESVWRTQGPFDGVVGFAQGGTLAAVLAAMQPHPVLSFRFAICVSSFPARAEALARYMQPGSITLPTIHVLGLNDILVTPDRSLRLYEMWDQAHATLVRHPGGHFVPSAWPYKDIHDFLEPFLPERAGSPDAAGLADAPVPPHDAPRDASRARYQAVVDALSATSQAASQASSPPGPLDVQSVQEDLHALAEAGAWKELQAIAVHAHALRADHGQDPQFAPLEALHRTIVSLFASQLRKDLDAAASMPRDRDESASGERTRRLLSLLTTHTISEESRLPADAERWPSACATLSPRIGSQPDKRCRLARDIAGELFPHDNMLAAIARMQQASAPRAAPRAPTRPGPRSPGELTLDRQAHNLSYQRYAQTQSLLRGILAAASPHHADEQMRRLRAPHLVVHETPEQLRALPLSTHITEPEPEPVVPCLLDDLDPLLGHLRSNAAVDRQTAFHKGTLTVDGRLDLCKQVVGPEGIGPLLGALRSTDHVKRLLLGNNIVGDGGAAAIAGFLRERKDSPLDCWYIAGNHITAQGLEHVCSALADDTRVTALWLKRNPLKPAGMLPLARLLQKNATLQVLDLVNCGLLDEGLSTLLGALMGPGANRSLRHLYVGTNGLTERSAPLLSAYLAGDCVLESLYLSCNRLGDEGIEALAAGLARNRSIRRLSLASNLVGPRGARALAAALAGHPTLQLLDLGFTKATVAVGESGNFLGDDGARAMAHLLTQNTTLRSLDLLHNAISQLGVNAMREALAVNRTLTSLQLTQFGKVHNEPGKEELRAALLRNRALVPPADAQAIADLELPAHVREIYSVYRTHV
jgi:uncharacterized protein (DUF924 family)